MEWVGVCRAAARQEDRASSSFFIDVEDPEVPSRSPAAAPAAFPFSGLAGKSKQIHKHGAATAEACTTDTNEKLKGSSFPLLLSPPPQASPAVLPYKTPSQPQQQQQDQCQRQALLQQQCSQQTLRASAAEFPLRGSVPSFSFTSLPQQQPQQPQQRQNPEANDPKAFAAAGRAVFAAADASSKSAHCSKDRFASVEVYAQAPAAAAVVRNAVSGDGVEYPTLCLFTSPNSKQTEGDTATDTSNPKPTAFSLPEKSGYSLGAVASAAAAAESRSQNEWPWQGAAELTKTPDVPSSGVCTAQDTFFPSDAERRLSTSPQSESSLLEVPLRPSNAAAPAAAAMATTAEQEAKETALFSVQDRGGSWQAHESNSSELHAAKDTFGSCPCTADRQHNSTTSSDSTSLPCSDCSSYRSYSSSHSSSYSSNQSSGSQASGWSSSHSNPTDGDSAAGLSFLVSPDLKCLSARSSEECSPPEEHSNSHALLQPRQQQDIPRLLQQLEQRPPLYLPQAMQPRFHGGHHKKNPTCSGYSSQGIEPSSAFRRRAIFSSSSSSSSSRSSSDTSDSEKGQPLVTVHSQKRKGKGGGTLIARRRQFNQKYIGSSTTSSGSSKHFTVHFEDLGLDCGLLKVGRRQQLAGGRAAVGVSRQCEQANGSRLSGDEKDQSNSHFVLRSQRPVLERADSRRHGRLQLQTQAAGSAGAATATAAEADSSSSRRQRLTEPMRQRLLRQYTQHLNRLHAAKEEARRSEETAEALQPRLVRVVLEGAKLKALQSSK
ncbi:hypothetical protein, conserved [Eimeria maxima]|uniref:Uncharacterized protein n=1 Tax=Eimeria maxima TaxID=5804 RepID=U6M117_EIMMA|nr:hypothetical protein, conserved [Eimeria maxima]CDJ57691.1 hypothetical protein, conserved [Eimeria maxima]